MLKKRQKVLSKKYKLYFGISASLRPCIHMLSLNYVNFMFLHYVVNSQSCLKICLFWLSGQPFSPLINIIYAFFFLNSTS